MVQRRRVPVLFSLLLSGCALSPISPTAEEDAVDDVSANTSHGDEGADDVTDSDMNVVVDAGAKRDAAPSAQTSRDAAATTSVSYDAASPKADGAITTGASDATTSPTFHDAATGTKQDASSTGTGSITTKQDAGSPSKADAATSTPSTPTAPARCQTVHCLTSLDCRVFDAPLGCNFTSCDNFTCK